MLRVGNPAIAVNEELLVAVEDRLRQEVAQRSETVLEDRHALSQNVFFDDLEGTAGPSQLCTHFVLNRNDDDYYTVPDDASVIAQELLRLMKNDRLLVVWMFDESESMKDDQKEITNEQRSFHRRGWDLECFHYESTDHQEEH